MDRKLNWRIESREGFYETLLLWWSKHNFPLLRKESLPSRVFVVSAFVEGEGNFDLYAVPVYATDSSRCWIGFPVSNKEVRFEVKDGALPFLLEKIETCMKGFGFELIQTTSGTPRIIEALETRDFSEGDTNINFYIKQL